MERESDLSGPVKVWLESRGMTVKGEIGAVDLMAIDSAGDTVLVELKLRFSLALFHQATQRLRLTDTVYIAVTRPEGATARRVLRDNGDLCRRLGIGLLTVRSRDHFVECHVEPGASLPRRSAAKHKRLRAEFDRRLGDPNSGGTTRHGLVTGYRQDALRCAAYLAEYGVSRGAAVARDTGVASATRIMADNHYGWFQRSGKGLYALTETGTRGLADWDHALPETTG